MSEYFTSLFTRIKIRPNGKMNGGGGFEVNRPQKGDVSKTLIYTIPLKRGKGFVDEGDSMKL
ncbi:hypothetical protein J21TS3_44990 [Paenibacillus cookii]|uniref:Uncharacterized protein n=1 Tax=Paenibacillus cookii TaxID=157839 RepID=A0ABQ4M3F9_9BACL|nr:hypothetical protein J21TS3_44990 [Paenibacillus cookii]